VGEDEGEEEGVSLNGRLGMVEAKEEWLVK
jgi:hypothetical protein